MIMKNNKPLKEYLGELIEILHSFMGRAGKPSDNHYLDGQDVMSMLHISPRTLQRLRSNGTLPFIKCGRKIFYRKADLERMMNDHYILFNLHRHDDK